MARRRRAGDGGWPADRHLRRPAARRPRKGGTIGDTSKLGTLTAYKLRPGSPAIDAALDTATFGVDSGPRDFFGNPKAGSAWDIGAAEYQR